MPLKPNLIERILINVGIIPTVLLDSGVSLFQASALLTAGDIRLFNHLKNGPLTLEEISQKTACSPRGVEILLNSMIPLGYINKKGNQYSLTKAMLRSFPIDLFPDMVLFFRSLNENLNYATKAVKTDPPGGLIGYGMMKDGEVATSFQVAMRWLGSATVKEVVSRMKLPISPKRMLDIGGSHGLYCVEFCRKYPDLKATVLDWAVGLENAKITLTQEKEVADRIDLFEADFEKENLPAEKFDFMFLGNIIHGLNEEGNKLLFKKIADATATNGAIAILDQYANVEGSLFVKGVAAMIGWNLFAFAVGRAYDFNVVKEWL
ncbi:MAG: methyltransferase domain-containing protein, partial [Ignavibacteria bacterium]|nr:methyltransferase domain-containing protein [Ignavibacteria bacterium]